MRDRPEQRSPHRSRATWFAAGIAPWMLGVAALALGLWNAGVPSYWRDEIATISATGRSIPELFAMLTHVDAVHGLYYFVMHYWMVVFGTTEAATRAFSAVAVALAVVATAWLGRLLLGAWWGLLAGALLLALPRTLWAAVEARSSGLGMLLAVVAFAAVTSAVRSRRWWWWAVAGVAIFATAAVQVLAVLSFMVLPLALAIQRVDRRCWWSFSLMATAAGAAFAPIGLAEIRQGSQVSWIPEFTVESFWALPQNVLLVAVPEPQWFSWLFVLVPVGALIVATVNGRLRTEAWRPWAHIALLAGWFGLPVAAVVLGTAVGMDLYVSRYLAYATPAVALLMASALSLLRARPAVAAAVSLVLAGSLAVTSAGQYSWFRSPDAKQDARAVAAWIGDHHRAGDGVVFDTEAPTTGSSRNLQVAYPDDFEGLVDLRLRETAARANTLFAQDERLRADRLAGISRVLWVVRAAVWTDELESTGGVLWGAGFNQHEEFLEEGWIVVVMER